MDNNLVVLCVKVLEDRIPFLMASVQDLQHFVPNMKDTKVSVTVVASVLLMYLHQIFTNNVLHVSLVAVEGTQLGFIL